MIMPLSNKVKPVLVAVLLCVVIVCVSLMATTLELSHTAIRYFPEDNTQFVLALTLIGDGTIYVDNGNLTKAVTRFYPVDKDEIIEDITRNGKNEYSVIINSKFRPERRVKLSVSL
jgi:glutamine cyclotransferase